MTTTTSSFASCVFVVFIIVNAVFCADGSGTKISCAASDDATRSVPNMCASAKNSDGRVLPNCVNIGPTDAAPEWVCAACSHNCDCDADEYCPKGPGQFTGTCRMLSEDDRIGRPCERFGYPGTPGYELPRRGIDDMLVCGSPIFFDNGTFARYDWIGACVNGECRACEGSPVSWTVMSALGMTELQPPASPTPANIAGHRSRDGGSLVCPGTICQSGSISRNGAWMYDFLPHSVAAGTLAFIVLIFFLIWAICILECCRHRRALKGIIPRRQGTGKWTAQNLRQQASGFVVDNEQDEYLDNMDNATVVVHDDDGQKLTNNNNSSKKL